MSLFARDSGGKFTPPPEAIYEAVCVDVIDLGLVKTEWGDKPSIRIVWQIDALEPQTHDDGSENKRSGKRFVVRRQFGLNLSEKGRLRPSLEAWRGRRFTKEELGGFDLDRLVGIPCQLQIVHNIKENGKVYANVQAVMKLGPKSVPMTVADDYVRAKDRPKEGEDDDPMPIHDEDEPAPF